MTSGPGQPTEHNKNARLLVRACLNDAELPDIAPVDCGDHSEAVAALVEAHAAGGNEAARRVFRAIIGKWPFLQILAAADPQDRKTSWTARELLTTDFPEPEWIARPYLPRRMGGIIGRPKLGKSWLMLQLAGAVATGGKFLGEDVEQGRVLYLALEDDETRLKDRLQTQRIPQIDDLRFELEWKWMSDGGLADLQMAIEREHYRLVIIDTISRMIGRADQSDIGEMTVIFGNLQRLASVYQIGLLLVDHSRKPMGYRPDPIDDWLGSTGKAGPADLVAGLYKAPDANVANLLIRGRDVGEQDLALEWDAEFCMWQKLGNALTVGRDTVKGSILSAIADLVDDGQLATTTNLADYLDKTQGHISRALSEMVREGLVQKGPKHGRQQPYILPDDSGLK